MRLIKKHPPPASFQTYIKELGASYEDIDAEVKRVLENALLAEQRGVCAYCQRVLKEFSIEHHCEQSICNGKNGTEDRRLDYKNLFAVCHDKSQPSNEKHCDRKKAQLATEPRSSLLPIGLNPLNEAHMRSIKYHSTGKIESSNTKYDAEVNEVLNLNIKYLKEARQKTWNVIYRNSKGSKGTINKKKMKRLLDSELTGGSFQADFPGLREYMRDRFCSR